MKNYQTTPLLLCAWLTFIPVSYIQAQVCTFAGQECCGEGITNFKLNGTPAIDRTSTVTENRGFTNTQVATTVMKGQTYNYSVTFPLEANIVNCNTYNFRIFVDFNGNNSLTDAGEEVVTLNNVPNGTHTGSFKIPETASTGSAYMRVMMKMANRSLTGGICGHSPITACNIPADPTGFHGEVENYTLNINVATSTVDKSEPITALRAYPHPFSSVLTLETHLTDAQNMQISVFDVVGKMVKVMFVSNVIIGLNKLDIDLSELKSGFYLCKIDAGNHSQMVKLLKN
jgi:hypothetical protein